MAKAGFYAVAHGRVPGIYASWEDCERHVKGYPGARYKKFKTLREAEEFVSLPSLSISTLLSSSSRTRLDIANVGIRPQAGGKMSKPEVSMDGSVTEEGFEVVYTDGACKGNGQTGSVAGVGVWWGKNDARNIAERCPGVQTNNRAELIAIARVLEQTASYGRPVTIKTDSSYSIKCLHDWHHKWADNNWRGLNGKPIMNVSLIRYILSLLQLRARQRLPVKFVYVKGHAGIEGNEGADQMANEGCWLPEVAIDRDWECERKKVEQLIKELEEKDLLDSVEVTDKVVQVQMEDGDDELEDIPEPEVESMASMSNDNQTADNGGPSQVSVLPASTADAGFVPTPAKEVAGPSEDVLSKHQPEIKSVDDASYSKKQVAVAAADEFCVEDLLSPDELEKELAEA